ncbi:hypothetical protein BDD14_5721 [Edaphobacter modestus]|uniref:Uncharacterized protein n=1 Tax=Edaphobacter modestus TaxID=388466 RepID=A0A4Q7YE83_9BACT|nr:hypothetical protein BDD14_5721 [Edaphobacter modestus]
MNSYQMVLHRPVETAPFYVHYKKLVHTSAFMRTNLQFTRHQ